MGETGKVRWYDSSRRGGVLIGVGGTTLRFTPHPDSPDLHAGEVVSYEVSAVEAVNVRPARRRAVERAPSQPAEQRPVSAEPEISPAAAPTRPVVAT